MFVCESLCVCLCVSLCVCLSVCDGDMYIYIYTLVASPYKVSMESVIWYEG